LRGGGKAKPLKDKKRFELSPYPGKKKMILSAMRKGGKKKRGTARAKRWEHQKKKGFHPLQKQRTVWHTINRREKTDLLKEREIREIRNRVAQRKEEKK